MTTTRRDFRYFDGLRVRWAEVDMQKIVFNGHYLMYFDTAVAGYWRAMAMPYHETMALLQGDLYVRKATLEYHASAHYEDRLDVGLRCARIGNSSMQFVGGVFRGDELLVSGELVYVFADPATQTSQPVPAQLRGLLDAFERGEAMVDVRTGTWGEFGREAQALRTAVFVHEQKSARCCCTRSAAPRASTAASVSRCVARRSTRRASRTSRWRRPSRRR